MSNNMENTDDEEHKESGNLPKLSADFQCSVCGSIFTTDQDREQHLKKEADGDLHEGSTSEDIDIARNQQELNKNHMHYV
jgi:hypothetical protein